MLFLSVCDMLATTEVIVSVLDPSGSSNADDRLSHSIAGRACHAKRGSEALYSDSISS